MWQSPISSYDILDNENRHRRQHDGDNDFSHRRIEKPEKTRSLSPNSSFQDLGKKEKEGDYHDDDDDRSDISEDEQENNKITSTIPMESSQTIKRKRRQSIVRLDYEKLSSDKGLPSLLRSLTKLKFKGYGFEKEDLAKLIRFYEHWAYTLYPRVSFTAVIERVERLCSDKRLKVSKCRIS
jgi:hypothetical protein